MLGIILKFCSSVGMIKSNFIKLNSLPTYILVGVTIIFIPLLFSNSTIDPVMTPRFLALSVFLLLVSFFIWTNLIGNHFTAYFSLYRRIIFSALIFYLFVSLISLTRAINFVDGIFEIAKVFLSIILLFIATIILSADKNGRHILTKSITISAIFLSIAEFLQYSPMANQNLFSSVLFMMMPFILYGFLRYGGRWRYISTLSLSLVLYNIMITGTRSVWVAMAVASLSIVLLYPIFMRYRIFGAKASLNYNRIGLIGLILIFTFLISIPISKIYDVEYSQMERIASIADLNHKSVRERITLWQKTLNMISENPILGVGMGNWKIILPNYGTTGMRSETGLVHFQRPHNDYLWVLAETGLFGLISYLLIFVIVFVYIFKILFLSTNENDKIFSVLILFGIVGFLTISFFSFPKERIVPNILLMFMIASILSIYHIRISPTRKTISYYTANWLMIPGLIMLSFSILVGYSRFGAEVHTKHALIAHDAGNWESVITEIDHAESWFYNMDPMATPISWYKGVANFSLNNINEALNNFSEALDIHPHHIHVLNNLGTCYEVLGDHERAVVYYKEALRLSPVFEEAIINLGAVYFNMGEYNEAYYTLMRAEEVRDNLKLQRYLERVKDKLKQEAL